MARKVRLTPTVRNWLSGTQLFQEPDELDKHGYGEGGRSLVAKESGDMPMHYRPRKDGSCILSLNDDELYALRSYAEAMYGSSRDDASWDPGARGDLNAAAALLRQLDRLGAR